MKILFLSEAVSLAHIGRPLWLAQIASENGIEVHFAASKSGIERSQANSYGFNTHRLFTIDEHLFYDRVNQYKFFYQPDELNSYVEEERELILKINPDLIVSDFRLTAAISSSLLNKPLLNLSNAYWSPNYQCKFLPPESGIFNTLPNNISNYLFNFIRPYLFKTFGKELNDIRIKFGLKGKNDFRELYTAGTYNAYMDLPGFVEIDSLPENHFYLGPIIWSPKLNHDSYRFNNNDYVYLSMGSTGNNSLLPNIIRAVRQNNLKLIISGMSNVQKSEILNQYPRIFDNCLIEPLIQAEKVLPFCRLTICHGGSGTVYQSINQGVPVLCFPKNPDQSLVSKAVDKNNIGRYLTSKNANYEMISKLISECISNELIHLNTIQMKNNIERWNTKNHWLQFLDKFKTIRKSKNIA